MASRVGKRVRMTGLTRRRAFRAPPRTRFPHTARRPAQSALRNPSSVGRTVAGGSVNCEDHAVTESMRTICKGGRLSLRGAASALGRIAPA
eukprot:5863477-Prymnesium_polylepis.1